MKILKITIILIALLSITSLSAHSQSVNQNNISCSPSQIYVGAYGGYGNVQGAYGNDGQVTQGRLALGGYFLQYKILSFGAEAAIQSGNTMRLNVSSSLLGDSGGLPVQSTLKPFIDFLFTVKAPLFSNQSLFGLLKGGVAYRQLQLDDRSSSRDALQKINAEFQAGIGYKFTEHALLTAFYQGIYSGNSAGVTIDSTGGNTYINRIPTQQAGFVGLAYSF